jgi:hypothetical protein
MEKRGNLLNQLAIIADLIEKMDSNTKSNTIIFEVSKIEFDRVFEYFERKQNKKTETPKNTFSIKIGEVDIVFNTSNV